MERISDYHGGLLNHLEGNYRPGDRALAVELVEALGLVAAEISFTKTSAPIIAIHPNGDDRDSTNNVIFLNEMPKVQLELDQLLHRKIAADPELSEAISAYRENARSRPGNIPHFGLRYTSTKVFDPVVAKLRNGLSPALRDRVSLNEMTPYQPIDGLPDIRQVFVYTDVFAAGPAAIGQLIELQVDRAK